MSKFLHGGKIIMENFRLNILKKGADGSIRA
jgi:hypothetical protein